MVVPMTPRIRAQTAPEIAPMPGNLMVPHWVASHAMMPILRKIMTGPFHFAGISGMSFFLVVSAAVPASWALALSMASLLTLPPLAR